MIENDEDRIQLAELKSLLKDVQGQILTLEARRTQLRTEIEALELKMSGFADHLVEYEVYWGWHNEKRTRWLWVKRVVEGRRRTIQGWPVTKDRKLSRTRGRSMTTIGHHEVKVDHGPWSPEPTAKQPTQWLGGK